jgi:hypothetical protein
LEQDSAGFVPVQLAKWRLAVKKRLQARGLLDTVTGLAGQAEGLVAHSPPLVAAKTAVLTITRVVAAAVSRNRASILLTEAWAFVAERANQAASLLGQVLN